MKKKFLFSLLAIVLCLPMMFLVTACGETKLMSLNIDTSSVKTTYYVGEEFSSEGLVVEGVYDDGTTEVLTDYQIDSSAFKKDSAGAYVIYVSKDDVQKSYVVTVVVDQVESLEIVSQNKYFIGQDFKSGIKISAKYNSGKTETLTDYTVIGFDSTTAGTKQVVITAHDKILNASVEVLSKEDYFTYAIDNVKSHVISSTNCGEEGTTEGIDRTQIPEATFDYTVQNVVMYGVIDSENVLAVANNGKMIYWLPEGPEGPENWIDLQTNTLYVYNASSTAEKRAFDDLRSAILYLCGGEENSISTYAVQMNIDMEGSLLVWVNMFTSQVEDADSITVSIQGDEVTLNLADEEFGVTYLKINCQNWRVSEYSPNGMMGYYKYDQGDVVPELPVW